jgi:hypothetical protein
MGISQITRKVRIGAAIALISVASLKGMTKTATTSDIFIKSLPELVENTKVNSFDNMASISTAGPKKHKLSRSCKIAAKNKPGVRLNKPKKTHRINDKNAFETFTDAVSDMFKSKKKVSIAKKSNNQGIDTLKITLNQSLKREKNPVKINENYEKSVNKDLVIIPENPIPKAPSTDIYYMNTEGCPVIKY